MSKEGRKNGVSANLTLCGPKSKDLANLTQQHLRCLRRNFYKPRSGIDRMKGVEQLIRWSSRMVKVPPVLSEVSPFTFFLFNHEYGNMEL